MENRTFLCRSCNAEFSLPFGTGQKGIELECPECGKKDVHRTDNNGHGQGRQPWGRKA